MKIPSFGFSGLALVCVGLAYGLLGWELSSFAALWVIEAWLATVCVIFLLIWQSKVIIYLARSGPRSLITILLLSMVINLAFSNAQPFGLALMLLLTIIFGRLELQFSGLTRSMTLTLLSLVAGGTLTLGWILGRDRTVRDFLKQPPEAEHIQPMHATTHR
ncbi:MAG TPA: hypothetical protein V6D19_01660 [Stenomitos sp.]